MNKIIDRTYMWFDDRFYILLKDEIEKAYSEGATIHPKIKDALINGAPEVWLPSSTTILGAAPKPWLADWKGRIGNEEAEKKLNEGGEKGSRVHDAIQVWTSDGMVIYNNPKKPLFTPEELFEITKDKVEYVDYIVLREQQEHLECWRLQQWFKEVNPTIISTEFTCVSLENMYAGRGDLLCQIKTGIYNINGSKPLTLPGGIYVVDYKTGKTFDKPNYYRQIGSYSNAIEENGQYEITGGLIIHTNDNKIRGGIIEGLKTYYASKEDLSKSFEEFLKVKAVYDIDLDYQPKVIELPAILCKNPITKSAEATSKEQTKPEKPTNGKVKKPKVIDNTFD